MKYATRPPYLYIDPMEPFDRALGDCGLAAAAVFAVIYWRYMTFGRHKAGGWFSLDNKTLAARRLGRRDLRRHTPTLVAAGLIETRRLSRGEFLQYRIKKG